MTTKTMQEVKEYLDAHKDEDVATAERGLEHLHASIKFLEEHFIGDSKCDGATYNCIGCDAVRLRAELARMAEQIEYIYEDELKKEE